MEQQYVGWMYPTPEERQRHEAALDNLPVGNWRFHNMPTMANQAQQWMQNEPGVVVYPQNTEDAFESMVCMLSTGSYEPLRAAAGQLANDSYEIKVRRERERTNRIAGAGYAQQAYPSVHPDARAFTYIRGASPGNHARTGHLLRAETLHGGFSQIVHASKADEKAQKMLKSYLTAEQFACMLERAYFDITSQHGNRYRLWDTQRSYNVHRINEQGRATDCLCLVTTDQLPHYDVMVIRMLMLQTEENLFLEIANRTAQPQYLDQSRWP